jgi:uncharacterized Zn-finger protein
MKKKIYKIKKCLLCGSDIKKEVNVSITSYYERKFCCHKCQAEWNTLYKSSNIECSFCGKKMRRRNSGIKKNNYCSLDCKNKHKTLTHNKDVECVWCGTKFKKKLSDRKTKRVFCSRKCMGEWQSKFTIGENSYNWRDGVSSVNSRIRALVKYSDWVKDIFKRDGFACQECGDKKGGNLNAHHKKQVSDIIKEFNLKEMIDILKCKELWDLKNGITLCEKCHQEIHKK